MSSNSSQIRFMQHYVTDGTIRARVFYSHGHLGDGTRPVTLYARDYERSLGKIFAESYENDTDLQSDYFDKGHVRIREDSALFAAALARCEQNERDNATRWERKRSGLKGLRADLRAAS